MILVWKNKGFLVALYVIVSFLVTAMVLGVLKRNVGGLFTSVDPLFGIGVSLFFASIWTYLTKNDYYKNKEGEKVKMDTDHEFFFIKMEIWVYILLILGTGLLTFSLLKTTKRCHCFIATL